MRTYLVLFFLLAAPSTGTAIHAQNAGHNVTIRVAVVDAKLEVRNVPKHGLLVAKKNDPAFAGMRVATDFEGTASLGLPAGDYIVRSASPLEFEGRSFA